MENIEKNYMKTLSACMNKLKEYGFVEEYTVSGNLLHALATGESYTFDQVKILNFYRFEGESDPSDSSILYVLESKDGKRGLLIDAYGVYSDPEIGKFVVQIDQINKNTDRRNAL